MSDQMIFKRYEIKYMLTREQKKRLCHLMKDEMIAASMGKAPSRVCTLTHRITC